MSLAARVDEAIDAALGSRIVGCVVLVNDGPERISARAAGFADREAAAPVREDALFRFASCTKPIVITAALRMIDAGLLSLDDSLTAHLPRFRPKAPDGTVPAITVRHLMTHTSGLSYDVPDTISRGAGGPLLTLDENLRRLGELPLAFTPGSAWLYGMSIDVLGAIIAKINGSDVEGAVARYVTGPLGMTDTHFHLTDPARLTTPYGDGTPAPIRLPEPHWVANNNSREPFSPRRAFERDAAQSGGGGMAGTAGDFMKLLVALRGDFLSPASRALAFSNQIGDLPRDAAGERWSMLGSVIADRVAARHSAPNGTVHWGGSWGNHWALDPATGRALAVFTNTMFEGFNGRFRDDIGAAVFAREEV